MEIRIFEFTIKNVDPVLRLWKRCEGIVLSNADSRPNLTAYLNRNPGLSFVAKAPNGIVGAVLCGHDGRRGYLHHLAVHADYRRQGIGQTLVEKCISTLQSHGIQKCHLFILNSNTTGIRFWERIGWTYRNDIGVVSKDIHCARHPI